MLAICSNFDYTRIMQSPINRVLSPSEEAHLKELIHGVANDVFPVDNYSLREERRRVLEDGTFVKIARVMIRENGCAAGFTDEAEIFVPSVDSIYKVIELEEEDDQEGRDVRYLAAFLGESTTYRATTIDPNLSVQRFMARLEVDEIGEIDITYHDHPDVVDEDYVPATEADQIRVDLLRTMLCGSGIVEIELPEN